MNAYPTWALRELETLMALAMSIDSESGAIQDDDNITRAARRHANNINGDAKAAKLLIRAIISRNDDILHDDGQEQKAVEFPHG